MLAYRSRKSILGCTLRRRCHLMNVNKFQFGEFRLEDSLTVVLDWTPVVMSNSLIQAKVKPSLIIIQVPENISALRSSLPATLLEISQYFNLMTRYGSHHVDCLYSPLGRVWISEQKYSSPFGSTSRGLIVSWSVHPIANGTWS